MDLEIGDRIAILYNRKVPANPTEWLETEGLSRRARVSQIIPANGGFRYELDYGNRSSGTTRDRTGPSPLGARGAGVGR
jgi:hypothetical protein